ncbi:response regulator [Burkholderia multivorans]|uniref:response regulator n=1 Tax=Burkholderia multivorans TaxID=87883 RepID=UPI000D0086CF|nr:response regulator [Burkholderia multivorans]MBU9163751.1 response regulator [Burkholderia multivorans]MBU9263395.1 response regulator [Burkholderia multivorans]PRF71552.1 DNA-binding response regulator [Burkholderia multivorans]
MSEIAIRAIVADDHPLTHHGIAHALTEVSTIEVVDTVSDASALLAALDAQPCDVLVLDYVMPSAQFSDGLTLIGALQRRYPALRIVVSTMLESGEVFHALKKLGIGCLYSKSDAMSHLIIAVHAAFTKGEYVSPTASALLDGANAQGADELSVREAEIVRLFREGHKVSDIARRLHRSPKTISKQKIAAMRKLGVARDVDLLVNEDSSGASAPDDGDSTR